MPTKAPIYAPIIYNWTGAYVGAHVGGGWGNVRQLNGAPGGPGSISARGWLAGAHAGFNWQMGSFVLGAETDLDWMRLTGTDSGSGGATNAIRSNWAGSVRARGGFAVDRALIYATGGWAYMNANIRQTSAPAESRSTNFSGWTLGAGVEYAFAPNWTGRVEYRYTDYNTRNVTFPVNGYVDRVDPRIHTVAAGVSYKF